MSRYEDDEIWVLWNEQHPQFRDWIDRINRFAQGNGVTEDDVDYMQGEFDFTISKDGEVLYTIHFDRESRTVSEHPHFYALNAYNKNNFNRSFRLMLLKKDNKTELDFYEKV